MSDPAPLPDDLRVYALVDPALVARSGERITRELLALLGATDRAKHRVSVSASSGWLYYVAHEELWRRATAPNLPSAADAKKAAETFLAKLVRVLSPAADSWPETLRGVALLPPMMKPVQLSAVPRPDGSGFDHWLYRAEPMLPVDRRGTLKVAVCGTQIEVRVGHLGRIISLSSRWRPITEERVQTARSPVPASSREHAEKEAPPSLSYLLDGDGLPQYYLAPYYAIADHHGYGFASACPWALCVSIYREQSERDMKLTAAASGGSGDYQYNWAYYRQDVFDARHETLGAGASHRIDVNERSIQASSIHITLGGYVMMINVRDRATGAFKHFQQQVFSNPAADLPLDVGIDTAAPAAAMPLA